jgi:hypothetical protein
VSVLVQEPTDSLSAHQITSRAAARRDACLGAAQKGLLLLTFLAAYLNPLLRETEESPVTAYRIILPFAAIFLVARYPHSPLVHQFVLTLSLVLAYSVAQMYMLGLLGDAFVWSYLLNVLAAVAFVHFVYAYKLLYGEESLFRHLYFWYIVLVAASVHQLATGFEYPVVPYRDGVARIFHGQENDASLAIAAFLPMAWARCKRDPLMLLLLVAGVSVIYINGTRGVLVAVAAYPLLVLASKVSWRMSARLRVLRPFIIAIVAVIVMSAVYVAKDVQFGLVGDDDASIAALVLDPIAEIAAGQLMDAELTSINLRVTTAVLGLQRYFETFGVGVGPGASTYFVREWYEGIALSMHVFPLQLMVESGWLFAGLMAWIILAWSKRIGWGNFGPVFAFLVLVTASITAGAITNYFFYACAVFAVTSSRLDGLGGRSEEARRAT